MRKGMKVFAAFIAAATASAMSLTAFAAELSITVEKSAVLNGNVTVTTTVTGAEPGEEVAYVVHKTGEAISDTSILYIDQKTATNGTAIFTFTDEADKIVTIAGSTVKVGTTKTANNAELTDATTLKISDFTVTYSVAGGENGNGSVAAIVPDAEEEIEIKESGSVTTSAKVDAEVQFAIAPKVGYALASVQVGDAAPNTAPTITNGIYTATVSRDCAIVFTFGPSPDEVGAVTTAGDVTYTTAAGNNSAYAYGKASGPVTSAGMFISASQKALTDQVDTGKATIAVSAPSAKIGNFTIDNVGSDGSFALKLLEDMSVASAIPSGYKPLITSGEMYGVTYVVASNGDVTFGAVKQLTTTN